MQFAVFCFSIVYHSFSRQSFFTFLLFYLFTFNGLFSPSHFFTFSPLNLFLFNVLYGIFARRNPTLYCHCGKTYQQNNDARHDDPRPPRYPVTVLRYPFAHEAIHLPMKCTIIGTAMTNAMPTYSRKVRINRRRTWSLVEPNTLRMAISLALCWMK